MKATTLIAALVLFFGLTIDAKAQRQIREVKKSEVKSAKPATKSTQVYTESAAKPTETMTTPQPTSQPNATKPTQTEAVKTEPLQATPSSNNGSGIKLTKEQSEAMKKRKVGTSKK